LLLAVYGVMARRDALGWLLLAWIGLALAKTFGVEPIVTLWNWVPGVTEVAFYRYAPPSWELGLIILAARCIDDLARTNRPNRFALFAAMLLLLVGGAALAAIYGALLQPHFAASPGLRYSATAAALWATTSGLVCLALLVADTLRWRARALA